MSKTALFLSVLLLVSLFAGSVSAADQAGTRRYNFVTKKYEFYDGVNWYNFDFGLPLGSCTQEGAMDFNTLLSIYQYCDGSNWIRLLGVITLATCSKKAQMEYANNTYKYCNGLFWVDLKGSQVS